MESEKKIWEDIFKNIKNIIKIFFSKLIWVIIGTIIFLLLMIPAVQAGDLSIFHAILISVFGGSLGYFLAPQKL